MAVQIDVEAIMRGELGEALTPAQVAARLGLGMESLRQLAAEIEELLGLPIPQARGRGRRYPAPLVALVEVALRRAAVTRGLTQREALEQVFVEHGWLGEGPRAPELSNHDQLRELLLQFGLVEHQLVGLVGELRETASVQAFQSQVLQERMDRFAADVQRVRGDLHRLAGEAEHAAREAQQHRALAQRLQLQHREVAALLGELAEQPALTIADVVRACAIAAGGVGLLVVLVMSVMLVHLRGH